jgi:hypothetical protein
MWAWKKSRNELTATEKLVLLSLADRANEDHECWPSKERLIQDTCLKRHTVFKAIASLESKGFLMKTGRKTGKMNRVDIYKLIGVEGRESNSAEIGMINSAEIGMINSAEIGIQNLSVEPSLEYIVTTNLKATKLHALCEEVIEVFKEELPDNPQPRAVTDDLKKNVSILLKRWHELYPGKQFNPETYRWFLQGCKAVASGFCNSSYERTKGSGHFVMNGIKQFTKWDIVVGMIEQKYR